MQLLYSLPLFHFRNIQSVNISVLIQLAMHGELFYVYSHVGTAKVAAAECVPTISSVLNRSILICRSLSSLLLTHFLTKRWKAVIIIPDIDIHYSHFKLF
jgi:hypothetical protein